MTSGLNSRTEIWGLDFFGSWGKEGISSDSMVIVIVELEEDMMTIWMNAV